MTFYEFASTFFHKRSIQVASKQLAPSTVHSDRLRFKRLEAVFGQFELSAITANQIQDYLEDLIAQGKSLALANRHRSLLSVYFEQAIRAGEVKTNPVDDTRPFPEKRTRERAQFWNEAELNKYLEAAKGIERAFAVGAAILGLAGARISECLALNVEDVLWKENLIRVNKIVEYHTNTVQPRTKGQKHLGQYMLLLVPRLKRLLKEWVFGKKATEPLIAHRDGTRYTYDQFHAYHYQAIYTAGVKPIPIHGLRRTYASLAARKGFHLVEISKMLGHETLTCVETYVQSDMGYLAQKAKKIGFGK